MLSIKNFIVFLLCAHQAHGIILRDAKSDHVSWKGIVNKSYTVEMLENNPEKTRVVIIDEAVDEPGIQIMGDDRSLFEFKVEQEHNYYVLYLSKSIDYESLKTDNHIVFISENGLNHVNMTLIVINVNDNAPSIDVQSCQIYENEKYSLEDSTCKYTVLDEDGVLRNMTFPLTEGNVDNMFDIMFKSTPDDKTRKDFVYLYLKDKELDYETKNFYRMILKATDGEKSTVPEADVIVLVSVKDKPDNPPIWETYPSMTHFVEHEEQRFKVTASDGDRGIMCPIQYKINDNKEDEIDQSDKCSGTEFATIDCKTGEVIIKEIDRDEGDRNSICFTITAYEVKNPDENSECAKLWIDNLESSTDMSLTFIIDDIDDNIPEITLQPEMITIDENSIGTVPIDININDKDAGNNAKYTVKIIDDSEFKYSDAFSIVPASGSQSMDFTLNVKDSSKLDYENPDWRNIKLTIQSTGTHNNEMMDSKDITITLNDLNDEPPKFQPKNEYSTKVKENIKGGTLILKVEATDADEGDKVSYNLLGKWANDNLEIDSTTGEIKTKADNTFDYEKQTQISIQVQASDTAVPKHQEIADITINVEDVNDETPTLKVNSVIKIEENLEDGFVIPSVDITAKDLDTNPNLVFSIDWENTYAQKNSMKLEEEFDIYKEFIQVETKKSKENDNQATATFIIVEKVKENTPNYEKFDSVYLAFQVEDLNTEEGEKLAKATVVINIININDNPPEFNENSLQHSVMENSTVDLTIGTVIATDEDRDKVTYSLKCDEDYKDWITIDENSGILKAKSSTIDCDVPPRQSLIYKVIATDLKFTTEKELTINLIDINDCTPEMDDIINLSIEENSVNKKVIELNAKDCDRDAPHNVVSFKIDPTPPVLFEITFDEKENRYYLGTNGELDRETDDSYEVHITLEDNVGGFGVVNKNNAKITGDVTDVNDNDPIITTTTIPSIKENVKKNAQFVDVLVAEDKDDQSLPYSWIGFKIEKVLKYVDAERTKLDESFNEDLFSVETDSKHQSRKATLIVNGDLRDKYGYYTLNIITNDYSNEEYQEDRSHSNTVDLEIEKYNFEDLSIIFPEEKVYYLSTKQEINKPLFLYNNDQLSYFKASDNQNGKYDLIFEIKQLDEIFQIIKKPPSKAELQLKKLFDAKKEYKLTVIAKIDSTNEPEKDEKPYETTTIATFKFFDLDQDPIFPNNKQTVEFRENELGDVEINKAKFNVDDLNLPIYYNLLKPPENFDLEETKLILKEQLDYEVENQYILTVEASNKKGGNPDPPAESILTITVNVIDVNDNVPYFDQLSYNGVIRRDDKENAPLLTLWSFDVDKIDENKLTYNLDQIKTDDESLEKITEPFKLQTRSNPMGVDILLNFVVKNTMKGHFTFNVNVNDGLHQNHSSVKFYIVSVDSLINFRFANNLEEVSSKQENVKAKLDQLFGYETICEAPTKDKDEDGNLVDDISVVSCYFLDIKTKELIDKATIYPSLIDVSIFNQLRSKLLADGLNLLSFSDDQTNTEDNSSDVLRAWLIGISVGLGALCIILMIAFILRTRTLNKRINNLSSTKFGSQDSGLNRLGVAAPTTNKHAIEGSNPVYRIEDFESKDNRDIDQISTRSGDSELIGVEELPDFDLNPDINNSYF